ncbi:hypothetical protein J6590_097254, partial [Homalodisca vitripennis]
MESLFNYPLLVEIHDLAMFTACSHKVKSPEVKSVIARLIGKAGKSPSRIHFWYSREPVCHFHQSNPMEEKISKDLKTQ